MVDIIVNNLAKKDPFWTEALCRAGKITINLFVKLSYMQKMICYGVYHPVNSSITAKWGKEHHIVAFPS